jgi:riboflavin kinase/FMN adenylyltransferase
LDIISWDDLIKGRAWERESAVTIGVFDGVHRGHRVLIDRITGGPYRSVAVTFSVSPRQFFHRDSYPGDVITLERKLELFACTGLDACVLTTFQTISVK